ncbi:MAG: DNA internalization-related competence protein ComEC/Rec2 [Peptoniphilus sp.]|nr:DNA internalization-related competence protein ComEC/Rec2 [Peptoniphilus sp.]
MWALLLMSELMGIYVASVMKISSILCLFAIISLMILYKNADIKNKRYIALLAIFFISIIAVNFRNRNVQRDYVSLEGKITQDFMGNENKFIFSDKYFNKYLIYTQEKSKVGDKVRIKGEVHIPAGKMNPYDFDYKNYLRAKGIDYIVYCDSVQYMGKSYIDKVRTDFREYVESTTAYLQEDNQKIVMSILLANTDYMDEMSRSDFRETGLSHVLAVSGLHIGIIFYVVDVLLKLVRVSKIKRRIIAILLTTTYIYLIYFPVGAMRSLIMYILLFMSFLSRRKYKAKDGLILSTIITLLINPYGFYSPSFIFSYLSVLGILLFANKIKIKLGSVYLRNSVAITLAASVMTIPLSLYYFNSYSVLGILSNILILPLYTLVIVLSYTMMFFKFLSPIISPTVDLILNIVSLLVQAVRNLNFINIELPADISQIAIYYLFLMLVVKRDIFARYYAFNKSILASAVLILSLSIFNYIDDREDLKMDFLYVDQAECTFIKAGKSSIMVDAAGNYDKEYRTGKIYTLNYLKHNSIREIDHLFLTHFDEDHAEGLLDIIDEVRIRNAYVSYFEDNEYLSALLERGTDVYLVKKGDIIDIGDDVRIKVISDSERYRDSNNKSMVFILECGGFKSLFTGDIHKEAEEYIDCDVDLLKVAHHGSKTSTSEDFLKRTTPLYATISAGVDNYYNHPDIEVINRLKDANIIWKSTNYHGQITLSMADGEVEFTSYLEDKLKIDSWIAVGALLLMIFIYKFGDYFVVQRTLQRRY